MSKEKLVYVLNPDGLTESIFVAKGEPNEGQYRGKRFTKAGLKAEKKRQREEALNQARAAAADADSSSIDDMTLPPAKGDEWVKSLEEYEKSAETGVITIISKNLPDVNTSALNPDFDNTETTPSRAPSLEERKEEDNVTPAPDSKIESITDIASGEDSQTVVSQETMIVNILGSQKGIVCVSDETNTPLFFREFPSGFFSKTEILEKLTLIGLKYPTIVYVETNNGETLFKGKAEYPKQ